MTDAEKAQKLELIYCKLFALYGEVSCPLIHKSPFQLLIAVMLSAQCTDKRVNIVTAELFRRFGTAAKMADAQETEIAEIIRPAGLYQAKSKNLLKSAKMLMTRFDGEVPAEMNELLLLPGVGRKSANVMLGNAFGIPGFPADTHVQRLLVRLGIVEKADPVLAEKTVCRNMAERYWTNFSHLLIMHGRNICPARTPKCNECVLNGLCKFRGDVQNGCV